MKEIRVVRIDLRTSSSDCSLAHASKLSGLRVKPSRCNIRLLEFPPFILTVRSLRSCRLQPVILSVIAGILFCGAAFAQQKQSSGNFDDIATRAAAARDAGQPDEAIRAYTAGVQIHPDWDEGWWYLGTLNYDLNHYPEAISAMRQLLQLHPQLGAAWAFLGLSEFETKDYKSSLADLQQARSLGFAEDPEIERVAIYHLALLLNRNGEFEKTNALLIASFGQSEIPQQIAVALGMSLLRVPLLPAQVDPSKDALLRAAGDISVMMAEKKFDQAVTSLHELLKQYPDTPYLHFALGTALTFSAQYAEAEAQFHEESTLRPTDALPYESLAAIALRQHDPQSAVRSAQRAVQLAPQSSAAHETLAQALRQVGRTETAARETKLAVQLASRPADVDVQTARIYEQSVIPMESTNGQAAARNSSTEFDQLSEQARAAVQQGQTDAAIGDYQRALKLRPDNKEVWRTLGTLCFDAARYADAASALKNAVALDPKHGELWALLGLSEFQLGDYQNALIHLDRGRALGLAGNQAAVRIAAYHTALLLNKNGEFDEAMQLLLPDAGSGPMTEQISFAMGISLLRIPALPDQIEPSRQELVRSAGEAAVFLSESKYEQAFPILERLLKDNLNTPYLHYAYGSALASLSRYDEAASQLREETRVSPESALPYLRLVSIYIRIHQPADAVSNAQQAVKLSPQSAEAHYMLGRSLLEVGTIPDAVAELEKASRLEPESPEVHFSLARAYAKAKRPDDAERERAQFERLNKLVQQQDAHGGNPTLGASRNQGGLSSAGSQDKPASNPE